MIKDEATPKGSNTNTTNNTTPTKPPFKIELALYAILKNGSLGITQPEAFSSYRESCLHTTISSLRHEKGIGFLAKPDLETVVYCYQKPFNRYWLASDKDRVKALRLLNAYRVNRGLAKVDNEAWHDLENKAA